jgi:hypothetical protein
VSQPGKRSYKERNLITFQDHHMGEDMLGNQRCSLKVPADLSSER